MHCLFSSEIHKTCISIITYSMLLLFFLTDMETSGKRDSKLEDIADGDTVQKEQFLCPLCPFNGKKVGKNLNCH
jgi:hypothetical protein